MSGIFLSGVFNGLIPAPFIDVIYLSLGVQENFAMPLVLHRCH